MDNDDLIQELQNRIELTDKLIALSRELTSTLDLPTLLDQITGAACEIIHTDASSILLLDKSGELYFEAASGGSATIKHIIVPLDSSIAGHVCKTGKPVVIADAKADTRHYRQADEQSDFTTHSLLAVPLRVKDKIIGVLEAVNKRGGESFNEADTEALITLAAQAAIAIENARLFEQSDQIAEMVHELRTPLTGIVAYSEMLQMSGIQPSMVQQSARTIHSEAQRLTQLVNDFLDLARLESGRAKLSRDQVNWPALVERAITVVQPKAAERSITVQADTPGDLPETTGDLQRLTQVLINLLSNAVKYNRDNGYVTVRAHVIDKHIQLQVEDSGRGIAEKDLAHMFEKFYRVADAEGWTQGTGLGLSIVKQIIEAHKGKISIESQAGIGTTVTFNLPVS
ncbi:MAG: GAF domain-containing sensor histidine kinase [Thermoflexales bacterium]|nr:GAF domain-containing sensor histidine kinase [Thermoflexales bacterium]